MRPAPASAPGAGPPAAHLLLALAVVAVWGTNFVVIHVALEHFPPLLLAALRFALAAAPWLFVFKRPAVPWRDLAAYGLLVGVGQFGLLYLAMQRDISPGLASLVIQAQVFFTVGLAAWLVRERVRAYQLVALVVAAAGLALIAVNAHGSATPRGLALTLLAALAWAASNLVVKKAGPVSALGYVVWASLFSAPPLFLLSLALEGWPAIAASVSHAPASAWAAVLWQSLANTIFGYGAWSWLLARHPAAAVAPAALLVPIFGLAAAAMALGEAMPVWKLVATALVLAGLGINLFGGRARRPAASPA